MTLSLLYWIVMLLWVLIGGWLSLPPRSDGSIAKWGIIPFILFVIIGLKLFGSPIQG